MLLEDDPVTLRDEEGKEIIAITGLWDPEAISIIQQWKHANREQEKSSGNVQILERVIGE